MWISSRKLDVPTKYSPDDHEHGFIFCLAMGSQHHPLVTSFPPSPFLPPNHLPCTCALKKKTPLAAAGGWNPELSCFCHSHPASATKDGRFVRILHCTVTYMGWDPSPTKYYCSTDHFQSIQLQVLERCLNGLVFLRVHSCHTPIFDKCSFVQLFF